MIAYFDTSAFVPLLVEEPGTEGARRLWDAASRVVSVRLLYPEARAALARARRLDRMTGRQHRSAVARLDVRYAEVDLLEIDHALTESAGELADVHDLRAYDAIHLAGADRARDDDLVVVAGDRALVRAATRLDLATAIVG